MITRDVGAVRAVVGFTQSVDATSTSTDSTVSKRSTLAASCGSLNGDSTANAIAGLIIDRLGLGRGYNSVAVVAGSRVDIGTSTVDAKFAAIYAWLYHSSTTCADDFDRFSTDFEKTRGRAFLLNTTSTLASGYMATSTSVGTFGTYAATATGSARCDYNAHYELGGAGRYLRPFLFAEAYASSSGGSAHFGAYVDLVFGEPDEAPRTTTSTGALYKN